MILRGDSSTSLLREHTQRRKAFHAVKLLATFECIKACLQVVLVAGAILLVASALVVVTAA